MDKSPILWYLLSIMLIYEKLDSSISPSKPCILTIGNFDGVHKGHQRILTKMRQLAGPKGTVAVITFSNHPSSVLPGKSPVPLIQSNKLKLSYLKKYGADVTYNLEFTPDLSQLPYDRFLRQINERCPFQTLVLGEGDAFGYKREGTPENVTALSKQMQFEVDYLPKLRNEDEIVSSGKIRTCIQQGYLTKAIELLGHPYVVEMKNSKPTSPHLCLPPDGDYNVHIVSDSEEKKGMIQIKDRKLTLKTSMLEKIFFIIFI